MWRFTFNPSIRSYGPSCYRYCRFILRHRVLVVMVLLVISIGGLITTATTSVFATKQDFATGEGPRSISTGDFNGDGKADLVVANANANTVSVLLNTTPPGSDAPSFAVTQNFPTAVAPVSVSVGDVNGDGRPDLVAANINSDSVSVLLNTTTPGAITASFAARQDFTTGDNPVSVTLADVNGDGKQDVVVANLIATVTVLMNTTVAGGPTASFAVKQDFIAGDGPRSVAVGDLNDDGKPDLAVASFNSNSVSVLLNTGDPRGATASFADFREFTAGVRPSFVTIGDLNGDGKGDLAVANLNSNNVSVLLNDTLAGAQVPAFADKQDFATGANPVSLALDDLNGDGKIDLIAANTNSNNVSVLLSTTIAGALRLSFSDNILFDTGSRPESVIGGDLNQDGKLDLAVSNFNDDTVSVFLNSPTVTGADVVLQRGSAPLNTLIANVTSFGDNGNVGVTITTPNPANGVTVSNVVNSNGRVTADVIGNCTATNASFTLQATDGNSTVSDALFVDVLANTAPTLTYQKQRVNINESLNVDPTTGPTDNGRITSLFKLSSGTFTGDINVDATGSLFISNAAPAGTHTITIRAIDNCGAITDSSFALTVNKVDQKIIFDELPNKTLGDPDFAVTATASSDLPVTFSAVGQCTVNGNAVHLTGVGDCTITASQGGDGVFNPAPDLSQTFSIAANASLSTVQFLNAVEVDESSGAAVVTVTRSGDTSSAASVDFHSVDTDNFSVGCADTTNNHGGAFGRCDFATVVGTLQFAAGETNKAIAVPIIDDAFVEAPEAFQITLTNPVGTSLGNAATVTVTIRDNDRAGEANPIFSSPFFVRQQYLDLLSREPDPEGFNAWLTLLNGCPDVNNLNPNSVSANCDRIVVSKSFFESDEFQLKGLYAFRFYRLAFNRLPEYLEIISDMSFVTGATADEVFARKAQLAADFTVRPEFVATYPTSMSNEAFVAALLSRYQLTQITTVDPRQPDSNRVITLTAADLATQLNLGTLTRAKVFRAIADSDQANVAEHNNAFVAMQYYGYLRRKPDADGFQAWLHVVEGGDIRTMIDGFMNSQEYRLRFGP